MTACSCVRWRQKAPAPRGGCLQGVGGLSVAKGSCTHSPCRVAGRQALSLHSHGRQDRLCSVPHACSCEEQLVRSRIPHYRKERKRCRRSSIFPRQFSHRGIASPNKHKPVHRFKRLATTLVAFNWPLHYQILFFFI